MISVSDGISGVALLLSLVSYVQSTRGTRYEKQRTIRGQLNEVLKQLAGIMIERQNCSTNTRRNPTMRRCFLQLSISNGPSCCSRLDT
jgi:hypothetical protein